MTVTDDKLDEATPAPDGLDQEPVQTDAAEPDAEPIGTRTGTGTGTGTDTDTDELRPQYGVGPFSIREVSLGGVWLLAFVVSFFPMYQIGSPVSVWTSGIDWLLTIGAPTVAVFLLALRRLSPQGIRRFGSLGIDQFASVVFTVSALVWLGIIWNSFISLADGRFFFAGWVAWFELIAMTVGVVLTVVAPWLPVLGEDFRYRPESVAHRSARTVRPISARPAPASAEAAVEEYPYGEDPDVERSLDDVAAPVAAPYGNDAAGDAYGNDAYAATGDTTVIDVDETPTAAPRAGEAFWALVPEPREVVDVQGEPLFEIGPDAWALVIEDRGEVFVVRHEDGRVGYLHDVSDVTRG